jgi:GNAT superfamily N-acetyltransferase
LRSVERLEKFWHNLILTFPWGTDVNGAVVTYHPEVPMLMFNHAADINVNEDEAENLLNRVTKYFLSRGLPFACFRISPITRPRSFTSFLEEHGFKRKEEDSVMVFKGRQVEDKLNPEVKVKEISESEIDVYNKLLLTIFEMPIEWKKGVDRINLEWIRKGLKCYLAYVEGKPVGTCALFSSMKTGGIFIVGTLKEYRRRGIGTTLTVHTVMDSIDEGNNLHTLQAEKGGYAERLYKKIGFVIDHTISYFVKKFEGKN